MAMLLATLLAPLLPYLLDKSGQAADVAEALGSDAWSRVQKLWGKLWPAVEESEAAREAVAVLAKDPDDEAARGALQFGLAKILERDPGLAQELERMVREGQQAGVVADNGAVVNLRSVRADRGGVAAGRDVHGGSGGIHTHWQGS